MAQYIIRITQIKEIKNRRRIEINESNFLTIYKKKQLIHFNFTLSKFPPFQLFPIINSF